MNHDQYSERELLLELITLLLRIRREQPSQLWLNEQFSSLQQGLDMTVKVDQLAATIQPMTDAVSAAVNIIAGIPQMITDAVTKALNDVGADESAQQAIIDQATAEATADTQKLKDALVANLPTPPAPPAA